MKIHPSTVKNLNSPTELNRKLAFKFWLTNYANNYYSYSDFEVDGIEVTMKSGHAFFCLTKKESKEFGNVDYDNSWLFEFGENRIGNLVEWIIIEDVDANK